MNKYDILDVSESVVLVRIYSGSKWMGLETYYPYGLVILFNKLEGKIQKVIMAVDDITEITGSIYLNIFCISVPLISKIICYIDRTFKNGTLCCKFNEKIIINDAMNK